MLGREPLRRLVHQANVCAMTRETGSLPDTEAVPPAPRRFQVQVLAAFAAAWLIAGLLAAGAWRQAEDSEKAALAIAHTYEVLVETSRLRADTLQIELSSQYFRLTGDTARLAERDQAIAARETSLKRLGMLTEDNPAQQARLAQMREIVAQRLGVARRVEQLRKEVGAEAAAAFAASAGLRESLARLLALRDEVREEEIRLLEKRSREHTRARSVALASAVLAAWALFGLLAGTYFVIRRQLRANEAARRELALRAARLRELNDALDRASRMKSDFLASMSHELRTPLNAIIGFSEILRDGLAGDITAQQREYLNDVLTSGTHLLALINDILDLSKVEAGKMTLEPENLTVESLLTAALSIVREKATAHRLTLDLRVAADCGEICADGRKVKQIVYNLLSNAVKFTPDGGRITLAACRRPAREAPEASPPPGTQEFLEITVSDTGIGISAENQKRLFAAFVQIDSSLARQYPGSGLGLALVKRLVELHGGAVGLESTPGQGTTFRVWLPYRPAANGLASAPRATAKPAQASGRRVLVVEDEAPAFELLRLPLEKEGFTAVRAANASEARRRLETEVFDLVTLDILLPGEDGWLLLDWLKKTTRLSHIPVVVVSIVADEKKGIALGASAVLQKPVTREQLLRVLEDLGFGPTQDTPARVLVIDDDAAVRRHLDTLLAAEGHTVDEAPDGREGLSKAFAHPPDLILLDLMMPQLSGFEVVTALRADARTLGVPIVIVTAKTLDQGEIAALNGQVQAVLQKSGFAPEVFLAEVRRALAKRGGKP